MEEESEKMMALKKGYVEIIMNTAKEAAARIMLSERKAHQYQHDLSSTKDEALRLLLRLKQAMDCKVNEVEMRSQEQQRKIDELEAQLQEAEDIVSNLRAELNETNMKLDELENNQTCTGSKVMVKAVDENGRSQPVMTEAVLASQADRTNYGFLEEFGYSGEPVVPSIILKRKELELYRNGCTQRIRACDGNLSKGHFSEAGELNHLKNVKELSEDKNREIICVKTPIVADTICVEEEKPVENKEVEDDENDDLMQYLKLLRKRTRASKYKRNNTSSLKHISDEDKATESNPPSVATSDVSEMSGLPENGFSFQSDDYKLTEIHADREQSTSRNSLVDMGSNTELGMKNSSLNLDVEQLDPCAGFSGSPKDKVVKYLRKRKKESVVCDDRDLLLEESHLKKIIAKKQNENLEPVRS